MATGTCKISGIEFPVSDLELALREKFDVKTLPDLLPTFRFRQLGAFWAHWSLHKRSCTATGKSIVSIFSDDCPYPVWHQKHWIEHADPPSGTVDLDQPLLPQLWPIFSKSPIPHNIGSGSDNCEYSDDSWYSKNCYLCHCVYKCEDLKYCYRVINLKDCQYCTFAFDSELCVDLVYGFNCFEVLYSFLCKNCRNSAFLYDCRDCANCLFCSNLRNKEYCFNNVQLSKKEYFDKKSEWDFRSRRIYQQAKLNFRTMLRTQARHRALHNDNTENCTGNFLEKSKNLIDCYFVGESEDCFRCLRVHGAKDGIDCVGNLTSELAILCSTVQDNCYQVRFSFALMNSRFMDYCAYCYKCENCFGCCGLSGKKFFIFNKPYPEQEYYRLRDKIIDRMKQTGEFADFFPGYFAPNPYNESFSAVHFPLSLDGQRELGFRTSKIPDRPTEDCHNPDTIPDRLSEAKANITSLSFWDSEASRPFRIQDDDLEFARKVGVCLNDRYYAARLEENFSLIPFTGSLRQSTCAESGDSILTTWPEEFDGKILSEQQYLNLVR